MLDIRQEEMNGHFLKLHVPGLGVLHRFIAADGPDSEPHDHAQWGFWSTILKGGYTEERFSLDGSSEMIRREQGHRFYVAPDDIHRIVSLHDGETWTLVEPDPHTGRDSGFYQWRDGVPHFRTWREAGRGEDFHLIR